MKRTEYRVEEHYKSTGGYIDEQTFTTYEYAKQWAYETDEVYCVICKVTVDETVEEIETVGTEYTFRTIEGDFYEGNTVTVELLEDGKRYTRKVKYSARKWGDLYITINGKEYPYSEEAPAREVTA